MAVKKRKPAQLRYDEKRPTISFRLDLSAKAELEQYIRRRGISYADFVKEALGVKIAKEKLAEEQYGEGYQDGVVDGMQFQEEEILARIKQMEFTPRCPSCGYIFGIHIDLTSTDEDDE